MSTVSCFLVSGAPSGSPAGRRARTASGGGALALSWGRLLLPLLTLAAVSCGVEKPASTADAGANPDGGLQGPGNPAGTSGLAVLSSDRTASSVALYNPATAELRDDCVHSGATGMNMAQALSADVTLPSQAQHSGALTVIDRKNAVITLVDPATCKPLMQFSVSTGGFKSNPQDVISISSQKLYVTRYEKNAAATDAADDFDDGDDILVVNATTGEVIKSIPLSGEVDPSLQARPDRGVLAEGRVFVTLGSMSGDFGSTGPGRVVVIDPATDAVVRTIDLAPQKNCSAIDYQAAVNKLYVSCGGAFSDGPEQAQGSALVEIDLSGAVPTVTRTIPAALVGGQPINFSYAAIVGDVALVGTLGSFPDAKAGSPGSADAVFWVALDGSSSAKVLDGGAYNLGRAAADGTRKRVFLPDGDATTPRVHVFDVSATGATESGTFESNPAAHLPPREVAWY
jgi:hypothetical protein